ncbi:probable U6 snRNA-associated Sm-like protein LSm6 [Ustilago bromivora]|uniref:U6 snRNA-associated Sm-like protein LSm6 n=1 Tax=Ustilago bromivora TaxID=307758 RepID=A0A8H8QGF9_9BASI|nr:probable U6 snRNA-associated Sm-like protein LSm6 [Ustilago bromivora]
MSSTQTQQQPKTGSPNDFLKGVIGKNVNVRLNSGIDYRGVLSCLDGYMNIALEQTVEYVDGVQKNSYGDAFIRGNNAETRQRQTLPLHRVARWPGKQPVHLAP